MRTLFFPPIGNTAPLVGGVEVAECFDEFDRIGPITAAEGYAAIESVESNTHGGTCLSLY